MIESRSVFGDGPCRLRKYPPFGAHPLAFMMPSRSVRDRTLWAGAALRTVARRPRNLSLEPSAGCRAVNHLGLTGSDPLQGMTAVRRYEATMYDSNRWDGFELRPGDIIISIPPKCGTTWAQMICALLILQ